jgi:hypothetical protein
MTTNNIKFRSGLLPKTPDPRDYKYKIERTLTTVSPREKNSLNYKIKIIYDQGGLGGCVCNSICQYLNLINPKFFGSRLFNYFHARELTKENYEIWNYNFENADTEISPAVDYTIYDINVINDSGVEIRNGLKSLQKWSTPPEKYWEYDAYTVLDEFGNPDYTTMGALWQHVPTLEAYKNIYELKNMIYYSVDQNIDVIKNAIDNFFPVIMGFQLFDSWYNTGSSGLVDMPQQDSSGNWINIAPEYHAVVIIGYDDTAEYENGTGRFEVINSYGPIWGDNGRAYIPYDYVLNPELAFEFWMMRIDNGTNYVPNNLKPSPFKKRKTLFSKT